MAAPKSYAQPLDLGRWIRCPVASHPLTQGTHLIPLLALPQGTIIADMMLVIKTAKGTSTGTAVVQIQDDQGTPLVYIGATAVDLEVTGVTKLDTATTGGAAAALLRPSVPDNQMLNAEVVIGTADAATSAVFDVYVLPIRDIPNVGP